MFRKMNTIAQSNSMRPIWVEYLKKIAIKSAVKTRIKQLLFDQLYLGVVPC